MTAVPKSSPALREPKTLRQKLRGIPERNQSQFRPTSTCRQCGSEHRPQRSTSRFCSWACWNAWESAKSLERRGQCVVCQATLARKRTVYCSHRCRGIAMTKPQQMSLGLPKRSRSERACRGCGIRFAAPPSAVLRGRGYCSRDCYNRSHPGRQARYEEATCAGCGVPFTRRPANMRQHKGENKFCSVACSKAYFTGPRSPAWRGGSNPNRGSGWLKRAEEARERDGHRCRRCGKSQEENGERLSVDHLIPWRTFDSAEEANALDNLVSLCRGCHAIKTQVAERAWLKGDVIAMQRHIEAVTLPSAVHEHPSAAKASGFLA